MLVPIVSAFYYFALWGFSRLQAKIVGRIHWHTYLTRKNLRRLVVAGIIIYPSISVFWPVLVMSTATEIERVFLVSIAGDDFSYVPVYGTASQLNAVAHYYGRSTDKTEIREFLRENLRPKLTWPTFHGYSFLRVRSPFGSLVIYDGKISSALSLWTESFPFREPMKEVTP